MILVDTGVTLIQVAAKTKEKFYIFRHSEVLNNSYDKRWSPFMSSFKKNIASWWVICVWL